MLLNSISRRTFWLILLLLPMRLFADEGSSARETTKPAKADKKKAKKGKVKSAGLGSRGTAGSTPKKSDQNKDGDEVGGTRSLPPAAPEK